MTVVTEYLANLTPEQKAEFERILNMARALEPEAEDGLSYGMPALKYKGRPLLGFIAAKDHLSFFPFSPKIIDELSPKLEGYDLSKGTIRFTLENPLSDEVITDLVSLRLRELQK